MFTADGVGGQLWPAISSAVLLAVRLCVVGWNCMPQARRFGVLKLSVASVAWAVVNRDGAGGVRRAKSFWCRVISLSVRSQRPAQRSSSRPRWILGLGVHERQLDPLYISISRRTPPLGRSMRQLSVIQDEVNKNKLHRQTQYSVPVSNHKDLCYRKLF